MRFNYAQVQMLPLLSQGLMQAAKGLGFLFCRMRVRVAPLY